jgi:uncharacterized alpha-E superfamily protein
MITRVADHCFWLGRYLERTESVARQLQVTGTIALDAEVEPARVWRPIVIVAGQELDFAARYGRDALGDGEVVQRYLTFDPENPVSLSSSILYARENARSVREVVSLEVWQTINELYVWFEGEVRAKRAERSESPRDEEGARLFEESRDTFYGRIRQATQLALGLLRSTMLHDTPLDFIWLGVVLERVSQTARLLDVQHHTLLEDTAKHPVIETALWLSLLRACSGFEAFMKRNRGKVTGPGVAAFLLKEAQFPRSVLYSTRYSRERLAAIVGAAPEAPGHRTLARLAALEQWITAVAPEELEGARVHEVLTYVVGEIHAVCDGVGVELLGHAPVDAAPASALRARATPSAPVDAAPPQKQSQ